MLNIKIFKKREIIYLAPVTKCSYDWIGQKYEFYCYGNLSFCSIFYLSNKKYKLEINLFQKVSIRKFLLHSYHLILHVVRFYEI